MSNGEEPTREQYVKQLEAALPGIAGADVTATTSRVELGTFAFTEVRPALARCCAVAKQLTSLDLSVIGNGAVQSMAQSATGLVAQIQGMRDFDIKRSGANLPQQHGQTQQNALAGCDSFMQASVPHLGYLLAVDQSAKKVIEAGRQQMETALGDVLEKAKEAGALAEEAKHALATIKQTSAETSVAVHEKNFDTTAKAHESAAHSWLLGTVGAIGLTLVVAAFLLAAFPLEGTLDQAITVQRLIARIAPIAFLSTIVFWCARNYRTHRHLHVVNAHRRNALRTFEAFVKGARDDATKNAVLLEATRSVFAPVSTGYASGDDDPNPSRIIEILRGGGGPPAAH
jgi:hypothetical protein